MARVTEQRGDSVDRPPCEHFAPSLLNGNVVERQPDICGRKDERDGRGLTIWVDDPRIDPPRVPHRLCSPLPGGEPPAPVDGGLRRRAICGRIE